MPVDYETLIKYYGGEYKGGKRSISKGGKVYKEAEFSTYEDATNFIGELPQRQVQVFLRQYGFIIKRDSEDTDRVGSYGWEALSALASPEYLLSKKVQNRAKRISSRISSTSESVYSVMWRPL